MGYASYTPFSSFGTPLSTFGTPWSSFGSPWNSLGTPWNSFASPWNSAGTPWGMAGSPWNAYGLQPWGANPWSNPGTPFGGQFPGWQDNGYPATWGQREIPPPYTAASLLDGRWFGTAGEVLEIRGNQFQLRTSGARLGGMLRVVNNIIHMYSPQTRTTTRYTFLRNQSELVLNNGTNVLTFRKHPADRSTHTF